MSEPTEEKPDATEKEWQEGDPMPFHTRHSKNTHPMTPAALRAAEKIATIATAKIILIPAMTTKVRDFLIAACEWLDRIDLRRNELPKSFLKDGDPRPLKLQIRAHLRDTEEDGEKCENCESRATTFDAEGVPLCLECAILPRTEASRDYAPLSVPYEVAQQLKRELTEAKAKNEDLRAEVAKVTKERDDWKQAGIAIAIRTAIAGAKGDGIVDAVVDIIAQRDAALAKLEEVTKERDEARKFGRQEALAIITEEDAESFPDDFQANSPIGDTGDFAIVWDLDKLKALLRVDESSAKLEDLEGAYWGMAAERDAALAQLAAARAESAQHVSLRILVVAFLRAYSNTTETGFKERCAAIDDLRAAIDSAKETQP